MRICGRSVVCLVWVFCVLAAALAPTGIGALAGLTGSGPDTPSMPSTWPGEMDSLATDSGCGKGRDRLTVCSKPCCQFASIQDAVNGAAEGDVIYLLDPIYRETGIVVRQSLTIKGLGPQSTAIQPPTTEIGESVFFIGGDRTVTIEDLTIRRGMSDSMGGAILSYGSLTVRNVNIYHNFALMGGGGIACVHAGQLEVINSFVHDNFVYRGDGTYFDGGGGILSGGPLTIVNSTISNNDASNRCAVSSRGQELATIINSTITGNTCMATGRGSIDGESMTLINNTITNNDGGVGGKFVFLQNNIIAGNSDVDCDRHTGWQSGGSNMFGEGMGCEQVADPSDLMVDPATVFTTVLGPLAGNGGPTPTHALLPHSPAVDAVAGECLDEDQRGVARPQDGDGDGVAICDIGSVEMAPRSKGPRSGWR